MFSEMPKQETAVPYIVKDQAYPYSDRLPSLLRNENMLWFQQIISGPSSKSVYKVHILSKPT